jgi:hypothetical protein
MFTFCIEQDWYKLMKPELTKMKEPRKKSLGNIVLLLCEAFALILLLTSCLPSQNTSPSISNPTISSSPALPNQQPIEVVSLIGPLPPVNPGGPNVEITLKNISSEPIVTLIVTLELNKPFNFPLDISLPVPLLPGNTISNEQTLISGSFNNDLSYPLRIKGTLRNGVAFDYTKQVHVAAP